MPYLENLEEFAARQGCPYVTRPGGRLLFANGAQAFGDALLVDPPPGVFECLRLELEFWSVRLKAEEDAFRQYRNDCLETARLAAKFSNVCPPPTDSVEQLRKGQRAILELRGRVQAIREQLEQSPEAEAERAALARRAEQAQQRSAVVQEIGAIDI